MQVRHHVVGSVLYCHVTSARQVWASRVSCCSLQTRDFSPYMTSLLVSSSTFLQIGHVHSQMWTGLTSVSPLSPSLPFPLLWSLIHSLFLSSSLPLSLSLFLRGGVWSTNDQHWWEADQATDLGHGKLLSLSSYTITPRDKPFHSPTKSNRCGEKWSSSDRLSDM